MFSRSKIFSEEENSSTKWNLLIDHKVEANQYLILI